VKSELLSSLPSVEEERALHASLLAGDRVAPSRIAEHYYEWLWHELWRRNVGRYPQLTMDDCQTAAGDALVAYFRAPTKYDPERSRLPVYLRMVAEGDLRNALRSQSRSQAQLQVVGEPVVEDAARRGNPQREDLADPAELVVLAQEQEERQRLVAEMRAELLRRCPPHEARAVELFLQDERATGPYAEALGLTHLPPDEQRRAVKRWKDRQYKRCQRWRPHD
jgi:hypothetical protein